MPDFKRIQANMDQMVYYMGTMSHTMPVMVNNTTRMADAAERMERKSVSLAGDLQKGGAVAERAIQNYSQAVLDNERAMIKALRGINQELGELRQTVRTGETPSDPQAEARRNAELQARLKDLEARLSAIASKVEKLEGKPR